MAKSRLFLVFLLVTVVLLLWSSSDATREEDEKDCADQLQNLASCIPYVSGSAKKPTPECCADTEKVRSTKPKCLCVLIKESADPAMALPVNTTLALQMPAACNSDAKVSDCPTILKLSPDSPDAKIFKEASGDSSKTPASSSTATSSGSSDSTPASGGGSDSKAASSNKGGRLESFVGGSVVILMVSIAVIFM